MYIMTHPKSQLPRNLWEGKVNTIMRTNVTAVRTPVYCSVDGVLFFLWLHILHDTDRFRFLYVILVGLICGRIRLLHVRETWMDWCELQTTGEGLGEGFLMTMDGQLACADETGADGLCTPPAKLVDLLKEGFPCRYGRERHGGEARVVVERDLVKI